MKGCLIVVALFVGAFFLLAIVGGIESASHHAQDDSVYGSVSNSGPYLRKASSSISRASAIVGNFPTGQDTADYAAGLSHIGHLHERIGNFTIYEVIAEGRAIREQRDAARAQQQRAAEEAEVRKQEAASEAAAAEEAHIMHGDPDCLHLDQRTLDSESGDYVGYVVGTVKNTCDRDFSYVQVEINFYRSDGTLENSGLGNINNLGSGDSWKFKVVSQGDGGTWKVEKISGF